MNSTSPDSIHTLLLKFAAQELTPASGDPKETLLGLSESHPIRRVSTIEEVGALVSYLVGPDSGFCIEGDFQIDGGLKPKLSV